MMLWDSDIFIFLFLLQLFGDVCFECNKAIVGDGEENSNGNKDNNNINNNEDDDGKDDDNDNRNNCYYNITIINIIMMFFLIQSEANFNTWQQNL